MLFDRRPLFVGNWKMNCLKADGLILAKQLAKKNKELLDRNFDIVICPPFTLLSEIEATISNSGIFLGAQNCHAHEKGAYTGDISALMLAELGCKFVIIGHADRRKKQGETDSEVKAKSKVVHNCGMTAIICIGETEKEYNAGKTIEVIEKQLSGSLPRVGVTNSNTVIAYEPIWAIGTGLVPSLEQVQSIHALIRSKLSSFISEKESRKIKILYGGSLNAKNAQAFLKLKDVDGGLVGGASLKAEDFWAISLSCV